MDDVLTAPLKTARILTEVIGKKVTHINLPEQDFVRRLISAGLSEDHATVLGGLEGFIRQGGEERLNDVVLQITGDHQELSANMLKSASRSGSGSLAAGK